MNNQALMDISNNSRTANLRISQILNNMSTETNITTRMLQSNNEGQNIQLNRSHFENIIFEAVNNMITNEILNITEDETIARAIDESLQTSRPVYKQRISEKGLSELKNEKFDSKHHLNETCPITLLDFSNNETEVLTMPCNHCFIPEAIKSWLEEKPECPICRHQMDSIEVKIEYSAEEQSQNNQQEIQSPQSPETRLNDPQTLRNYPTSSQFLNRLLYLNEHQEDIYTSRTTFLRNLNNLN